MRVVFLPVLVGALLIAGSWGPQGPAAAVLRAQETGTASALDFEFFKTRVQPIFLARRDGHTRCVSCHSKGTPMRLQALSPGATTWNDEQSRKNLQVVLPRVAPRRLSDSKLLMHPLLADGGGDFYHSGGKHWNSFLDPEWQIIANWVCGRKANEKLVQLTGSCTEE
jgi:hypothetical protein